MAEVDLLIKLFDTLKDSIKDMQNLCQALLTNQTSIGSYMKSLPMDEVKQLLKEHSKESTDEIGTCTETVETQTDTILTEVRDLKGKVRTMIVVVLVAFALFTSAVLIGRLSIDTNKTHDEMIPTIVEEVIKQLDIKE
jgi:gas vesicle protein